MRNKVTDLLRQHNITRAVCEVNEREGEAKQKRGEAPKHMRKGMHKRNEIYVLVETQEVLWREHNTCANGMSGANMLYAQILENICKKVTINK